MKTLVLLMLTLGIVVGVIANPVSKQTIPSENKNSPQAESDSQTKHREVINTSNKGDQEQKKDTIIVNPESSNIIDVSKSVDDDGKLGIIIEENVVSSIKNDPLLPGDNCDHDDQDTKKDTITKNSETPNIIDTVKGVDVDGKVVIIIRENIVSPINNSSLLLEDQCDHGDQETKKVTPTENPETPNIDTEKDIEIIIEEDIFNPIDNNPHLQGDFSDEPKLPGLIEDSPLNPTLPDFIGDGPHLPHFFDGPQITDLAAGSLQFPGFVEESSQLSNFIADISQLPEFNDDGHQQENSEDDFPINKDYFREVMQKVDDEIMETAAGFIPTPLIFRRKQKPRRRFATRRHFRRNPYRRHQFFYPYSYYAFYRPRAL